MKYIIQFQSTKGTEETTVKAKNEQFARAAFYEIYNRNIKILSITQNFSQAA